MLFSGTIIFLFATFFVLLISINIGSNEILININSELGLGMLFLASYVISIGIWLKYNTYKLIRIVPNKKI